VKRAREICVDPTCLVILGGYMMKVEDVWKEGRTRLGRPPKELCGSKFADISFELEFESTGYMHPSPSVPGFAHVRFIL
jgi:hypothetical protein